MEILISAFLGFFISFAIFINVGVAVGKDTIQEECLIKQEFVVEGVKFKCEMVKDVAT